MTVILFTDCHWIAGTDASRPSDVHDETPSIGGEGDTTAELLKGPEVKKALKRRAQRGDSLLPKRLFFDL